MGQGKFASTTSAEIKKKILGRSVFQPFGLAPKYAFRAAVGTILRKPPFQNIRSSVVNIVSSAAYANLAGIVFRGPISLSCERDSVYTGGQ